MTSNRRLMIAGGLAAVAAGPALAAAALFAGLEAKSGGRLGVAALDTRGGARLAHRWPGNVRELENAMHRAVLLATGPEIEEYAIRLPDGQPMSATPDARTARNASMAAEATSRAFVGQTVAVVEQLLIIDTLSHCLGNRTHAANILGISIRTLRNKLKEYSEAGVAVPAPQGASAHAA